MSLPKIQTPIFSLVIPSTQEKKKFRPFLVKEEKLLLLAQQGSDNDLLDVIIQIINNCCLEKIDFDKLTSFDFEYIFLKLRAKSVNNIVELRFKDKEDEKIYTFDVDLDTIEIEFDKNNTNKIKINDDLTLLLKYPGLNLHNMINASQNQDEVFYSAIMSCLDKVYTKDDAFSFSEYTFDECKEFLDSLDVKTFEKIQKFLKSIPRLRHVIEYKNSNGTQRKIVLEGLRDFFP